MSNRYDDTPYMHVVLYPPFIADYNAFKEVLTSCLDPDVPDIEELVQLKWEKYGQKFLQLCINHKTGIRFISSVLLHC
jgi:hypothetical protein